MQHPIMQHSEELTECARGHYEAVVTNDEYKVADLFAKDKDVKYIVDIGANVGCASYQFQKFYPKAKILVCEPVPELLKYAKLNTKDKLTYIEKAIVGKKYEGVKEVKFNVCKWAGNGHVDGNFRWDLFEPMGSKKDYDIQVPAISLADLIKEEKFPRIDLLKIDCEGLEGDILQGFKRHMKKVKHFRGEWHGQEDIPLIQDALEKTHNIYFDRRLTTHGDIFATRKDFEAVVPEGMDGDRKFRILPNGKRQYML